MKNDISSNEIENYINDFNKRIPILLYSENLIPAEISIWYKIYETEIREHTGFSSFINED